MTTTITQATTVTVSTNGGSKGCGGNDDVGRGWKRERTRSRKEKDVILLMPLVSS